MEGILHSVVKQLIKNGIFETELEKASIEYRA